MAWTDPRAAWRRWYKVKRKAERSTRARNRHRSPGSGFLVVRATLAMFREGVK